MKKRPERQENIREESKEEMREAGRKVKFIENPLPLPRKHVKKTMDYKIEVAQEQMKYDREVREDDDFDLQ